jgi:hypothetical protein
MNARCFAWLALCALVFVHAPPAFAQARDQDTARESELKKQGDELMHSMHFREALAIYDAALKIKSSPAIHYNRARALEALGEYPQALDALEEFVRVAQADLKALVPDLDDRLASIRGRIATLVVNCSVQGASVIVRQKVEGTTPLASPLRLSTGAATVEVQASGYVPFRRDVQLPSGQITTIDVVLEHEAVPVVVQAASPVLITPAAQAEKPQSNGWKLVAYTTGSVGIVSTVIGAATGGLAIGSMSTVNAHCPGKVCDPTGTQARGDAWTYSTLSTIGFIVGGVGLATSAVVLVVAPWRKRSMHVALGFGFVGIGGVF